MKLDLDAMEQARLDMAQEGIIMTPLTLEDKQLLQSIYEISLSDDIESKDLAISLFWTSNYVKESNIKPTMRLGRKKDQDLRLNIGHYLDDNNIVKYNNFISILDDLIHDNAYFIEDELK